MADAKAAKKEGEFLVARSRDRAWALEAAQLGHGRTRRRDFVKASHPCGWRLVWPRPAWSESQPPPASSPKAARAQLWRGRRSDQSWSCCCVRWWDTVHSMQDTRCDSLRNSARRARG